MKGSAGGLLAVVGCGILSRDRRHAVQAPAPRLLVYGDVHPGHLGEGESPARTPPEALVLVRRNGDVATGAVARRLAHHPRHLWHLRDAGPTSLERDRLCELVHADDGPAGLD